MDRGRPDDGSQKQEPDIHHWKDKFARSMFGEPDLAISFLKTFLPWLNPSDDWSTLTKESGSFIDKQFRQQFSDLLFSLRVGRDKALIYILFEHKSKPDPWALLYLLQLMVNIWTEWRGGKGKRNKRLPIIIPIILHQSTGAWTAPLAFQNLFDAGTPELMQYVPKFEAKLVDLVTVPVEDLSDDVLRAILSLMVAVLNGKPVDWLRGHLHELSKICRKHQGNERLMMMLNYLRQSKAAPAPLSTILEIASNIPDRNLKKSVMSWTELIKQEGRQEGRQEGSLIGQVITFRELLGLPALEEKAIASKSLEDLRKMADTLRAEAKKRFR
jgi:predicted transposase/invertase (TIGR01784 family)